MNYQDMTKEQLIEYIYKKEGKLIHESKKIELKLISINDAYFYINGRKIKKKKSREFEQNILMLMDKIKLENNKTYRLYVEIYLYNQAGDVDNRLKLLIDMIELKVNNNVEKLQNGFNDKQFIRIESEKIKVEKKDQGIKFYIYEYDYDTNRSLEFKFPTVEEFERLKKEEKLKNKKV